LSKQGVPADHIKVFDSEHTAQAFHQPPTWDDNQINGVSSRLAMQQSHANKVSELRRMWRSASWPRTGANGHDPAPPNSLQRPGFPSFSIRARGLAMFRRAMDIKALRRPGDLGGP